MAESVDIDLYENIEDGFDQDGDFGQDSDLYDDVIITSHDSKGSPGGTSPSSDEPKKGNVPLSMPAGYTGRRFSVYVGNLTWWTTDQDLTDALNSIGVNDLLEIKFYENRANGQSKGFAIVIVKSEMSSRAIFDKLPRKDLHGQTPMVTHCNKQALNNFEAQARKGEPPPPQQQQQNGNFVAGRGRGDNRGEPPPRPPVPTPPQQAPPPRPQPGVRPPNPFPPQVRGPPPIMGGPPLGQGPPVVAVGPPPNFFPGPPGRLMPEPLRPGMPPVSGPPINMAPGGLGPPRINHPPPGMPMRPEHRLPPPGLRPGGPPVGTIMRPIGAPYPIRGQGPPQPVPPPGIRGVGPPGMLGMPPQQLPPGVPPPGHPAAPPAPHVNPAFFPPQHGSGLPPPASHAAPPTDPFGRPPLATTYPPADPYRSAPERFEPKRIERSEPPAPQLSEQEFEEIFQRNKTVSSSAISRAVQDASAGDFASAIETLVTAISLIKQSKIANDDRCKILISSLQDTLHGIEEKSYGSKPRERRSRSRERERDTRDREKRSRHRSRSREREYRERSRERETRREYEERHRDSSRSERRDSDRDRERTEREREYRSSRH